MKVDFRVSKEEAVTAIEVLTQARDKIQAINSVPSNSTPGSVAYVLMGLYKVDICDEGSYISDELEGEILKAAQSLLSIHHELTGELVPNLKALSEDYDEAVKRAQTQLTKEAEFHLRELDERDPDRPRLTELIGQLPAEIN